MPKTMTEKMLSRAQRSSGVLVPLIEEFLENPLYVKDINDVSFLADLLASGVQREEARLEGPVFSPSSLASCLRQVYLGRNHEQHGLVPVKVPRVEPSGYFLTGNFIHYKWQFVLWALNSDLPDDEFQSVEFEYRVVSKHGDHAGTIDVIVLIDGEPFIVDIKGLNVRSFQQIVRGDVPDNYRIQLADYLMLYNASKTKLRGIPKIEKAILLVENKGGPDSLHPLALTETIVDLKTYLPEVRMRLEALREHEANQEVPAPECKSTGTLQFQSCPFQVFCRKEVKARERKAKSRNTARRSSEKPTPARTNRTRRTRRSK